MLLSNHYSTPPHEVEDDQKGSKDTSERRPSFDPHARALHPIASFRHHPYYNRTTPSPSSSRRGSLTDPALHATFGTPQPPSVANSPPPSPLHMGGLRPAMDHRAMTSSLGNNGVSSASPWRRESLPSISQLTGNNISRPAQPNLFDESELRRHSIAATSMAHDPASAAEEGMDHEMEQQRRPSQMYSRSPELRVSHKLAERKRRKEMKELFDELRDLLPTENGVKTSKWEILSKTLDYIAVLQKRDAQFAREKAELERELLAMKRA